MAVETKLAEHIVRKLIAVSVAEEGDREYIFMAFSLLIRFCTIWWECVYEKVEYKNCYAFFSLREEGIFSKNRSRDFAVAENRKMWYTKQKRSCAQFEEEGECYEVSVYDDQTEIVHSEMHEDGTVEVYIEKPDEKDCFHSVSCYLPKYEWKNNFGFTQKELDRYQEVIQSTAHLIMEFSQSGGLENAASF